MDDGINVQKVCWQTMWGFSLSFFFVLSWIFHENFQETFELYERIMRKNQFRRWIEMWLKKTINRNKSAAE